MLMRRGSRSCRRGFLGTPSSLGARCPGAHWESSNASTSVLGAIFWARLAASEHAAARWSEQVANILGSLGAPVALVLRTRNICLTKRHQSRLAFEMATQFGGAQPRPRAAVSAGRMPRDLRSLTEQLAIEGVLSPDYVHRYAELAGWMCTRPPLSTVWASISAGEAANRDAWSAALQWLARAHPAEVEPALRRVVQELSDREAPVAVPWWLRSPARRAAGVLPRHSETELFALARRQLEDRIDAVVGPERLAGVNAVLAPGG